MSQHESQTPSPRASITSIDRDDDLAMALHGRFDAHGAATVWEEAVETVRTTSRSHVSVDCADIEFMDGPGLALLLRLREEAMANQADLTLNNLGREYRKLVDLTWDTALPRWTPETRERRGIVAFVGQTTEEVLGNIRSIVTFVGEMTALLFHALFHPGKIRWKDVWLSCINVGVDSLFIIGLIGFLMGLIMSFQSAISLQRFGGEIFVPNMLGLVMFREMGPLVTCILLAARSGSAFAAEIGTMKINEELDALTTMGLSPMRFLVLPKILSTMMMVPFMTLFFNLCSLVGGALVMLALGFPLVTFTSRVFSYLHFSDFWGGMAKTLVFASLVAGVGCLRGMQTREGASAVGLSTTSAVVSGIILIAFADGLFAVAFYYLGI